jgi:hypothetical protein
MSASLRPCRLSFLGACMHAHRLVLRCISQLLRKNSQQHIMGWGTSLGMCFWQQQQQLETTNSSASDAKSAGYRGCPRSTTATQSNRSQLLLRILSETSRQPVDTQALLLLSHPSFEDDAAGSSKHYRMQLQILDVNEARSGPQWTRAYCVHN